MMSEKYSQFKRVSQMGSVIFEQYLINGCGFVLSVFLTRIWVKDDDGDYSFAIYVLNYED